MSAAEDLADKAARLKSRQAKTVEADVRRSVPTPEPAGRTVRLSVDIPARDHADLARWCLDAAAELGVARVAGQELIRELIRQALTDTVLQQKITDGVKAHRDGRAGQG
jgi:hypothetical protein